MRVPLPSDDGLAVALVKYLDRLWYKEDCLTGSCIQTLPIETSKIYSECLLQLAYYFSPLLALSSLNILKPLDHHHDLKTRCSSAQKSQ